MLSFMIAQSQTKVNPIVKSYGTVMETPFATENPDAGLKYNILVDLMMGSAKPDTVNEGLTSVATLINLHAVGGVKKENIDLILVVHNRAGNCMLNNDEYQKKFKVDNPNIPVINALKEAGVKIYFCGQTLLRMGMDEKALAPGVEASVSALTAITTYQLKGYAVIKW
jgi:intracellular sulfur oxidation DsrE/DsrF family protein